MKSWSWARSRLMAKLSDAFAAMRTRSYFDVSSSARAASTWSGRKRREFSEGKRRLLDTIGKSTTVTYRVNPPAGYCTDA